MTRLWCVADVHGFHDRLIVPDNIDGIVVAGDISNSMNRRQNHGEVLAFLDWLERLDLDFKIMIAGNHDTSIEAKFIIPSEYHKVIYLQHEPCTIQNGADAPIKIFGSPYTPSFGQGWAFNISRSVSHEYWRDIPAGTDLLVTHGPPKYILDLSYSIEGKLEYCGDKALYNAVDHSTWGFKPKFHVFGHIHNMKDVINQGTRTVNGVTYVNASCVEDGRFDKGPTSNGVIIEL